MVHSPPTSWTQIRNTAQPVTSVVQNNRAFCLILSSIYLLNEFIYFYFLDSHAKEFTHIEFIIIFYFFPAWMHIEPYLAHFIFMYFIKEIRYFKVTPIIYEILLKLKEGVICIQ